VGLAPYGDFLIWAKNSEGTRIFSVSPSGYMYAKNG
jgi:hypothetical protein